MAYNAVAQGEGDTMSDSNYSETSTSPRDEQSHMALRTFSPDFQPSSQRSRHVSDVSREGSIPLRHPTPDLQSLQGAYVGNVERLEQSAERLSLSSDIGEELRKLREKEKESDSRRSSMRSARVEDGNVSHSFPRQLSYGHGSHASNSIVDTNNVARSGGFSPAGYFASPRSSIRSGSWSQHNSVKGRSASQGSRLMGVLEPEHEGMMLRFPSSGGFFPIVPPLRPSPKVLHVTNDEASLVEDSDIPHEPNVAKLEKHEGQGDSLERPASTDTYQQANGLFEDFDGVHITHQPQVPSIPRDLANNRISFSPLPSSTRPKSYLEPLPDENMVYYPAPVPMILNLPKRLSKLPSASQRDKRRSEILGTLPADVRNSAAWLPEVVESGIDETGLMGNVQSPRKKADNRRSTADVPPQLRASAFFDYPAAHQDIEVKGGSAVATLDSILDASALAPVTAFTDHPIAGHIGAQVYGRNAAKDRNSITVDEKPEHRRRRSSLNLLGNRNSTPDLFEGMKKRNSSLLSLGTYFGRRKSSGPQLDDPEPYLAEESEAAAMHLEETPLRQSDEAQVHEEGEIPDDEAEFHDAQEELENEMREGELDGFNGQPTTLLAELQLRKRDLKSRTRTAATAFPDGMHSTLLELDAVAQIQKKSRQQKHITLAWEDPGANHPGAENMDDEDIPLGMLFPESKVNINAKSARYDEDRPLGLIARRDLEDNEPLSRRRARLRGDEPLPREQNLPRKPSTYTLDLPGLTGPQDEQVPEFEGETLGQRLKRLKSQILPSHPPRPISGDFTTEIMSQLGVTIPPTPTVLPASDIPDDETLGQRRKRLQAEREANEFRDVSGGNGTTAPPATTTKPPLNQRRSMADLLQVHPAAGGGASRSTQQVSALKTRNTPWAVDVNQRASSGKLDMNMMAGVGVGGTQKVPNPMAFGIGAGAGVGLGAMAELDRGQRDMIDRWRQSVMH